MLKTYVISILQYVMRAFSLPNNYVKNLMLFYIHLYGIQSEKNLLDTLLTSQWNLAV